MGKIKGVIFDMDGVLVDSEKFICEAAIELFAERNVQVQPEDFLPFIGTGESRFIGGVAEKYNVSLDLEQAKARTYQLYEEKVKGRLKPLGGVYAFIDHCRQLQLKLAVATSADRIKMEINLHEIGLTDTTFDATVNGLEVVNKKPHPEIFLKAAAKLGLSPDECLVVEDAINGIQAAKVAGCKCLGLTTTFRAEQLKEADWNAADLSVVPEDALRW